MDVRGSASRAPDCMLAAWLVGTEHADDRASGEVCIFEIDAAAVGEMTAARPGLKAHGDLRLTTDMVQGRAAVRGHAATHLGRDLGPRRDHHRLRGSGPAHLRQAPDYPLFLMLDRYDVGGPRGECPKAATIHSVRGWQSD